jgi:predicted DNA-binding protein
MPINKNELTKELIEKAMQCETAEDLIALAMSEGVELTKEEAEAYLAELDDFELDDALLRNVAGGQKCNSQSCPDNKPLYS